MSKTCYLFGPFLRRHVVYVATPEGDVTPEYIARALDKELFTHGDAFCLTAGDEIVIRMEASNAFSFVKSQVAMPGPTAAS